jgi:inner membrane protein
MKRSHALIGTAAGVATAKALGGPLALSGLLTGLAALLPDVDHPHSLVGRMLPRWWHRLTPGHRGPTHSLAWCAGLALLVWAAQSLAAGQPAAPLLATALAVGTLSHVLADGLTVAGVPLWWPVRRRRLVFLGALAFRTHSWAEVVVVGVAVAGTAWWVAHP